MPTYYAIKEIYYKEKREKLKGTVSCDNCGKNVPKFIMEAITHACTPGSSGNILSKSLHATKICVRCSTSYFDLIKSVLISKNMAIKLKNAIDKKEIQKYAKLCLIIQKS